MTEPAEDEALAVVENSNRLFATYRDMLSRSGDPVLAQAYAMDYTRTQMSGREVRLCLVHLVRAAHEAGLRHR